MDKTALLRKIAENLILITRQDMEQHPDLYLSQEPPSNRELVVFLNQQNENPNSEDYQMKMAEAIKRRLILNQTLLDE